MNAPTRLREIVSRLGGTLYSGGTRASVPGPNHSKRDRSLSLWLTPEGRVLWHSFVPVEPAKVWNYLGLAAADAREMNPSEAYRARQEGERARQAARRQGLSFCRTVWRSTKPAEGSPVEVYLREVRGIRGLIPQTLRWAEATPLGYAADAPRLPAMVALVQQGDAAPAGLHVTFLRADGGGKANLRNPRRMFGNLEGCAIRLSPAPALDAILGVAEGVETALSFRDLSGVPTWAAGSAAALSHFVPPLGLSRLIVAADADDDGVGLAAARQLAAHCRCNVTVTPAPIGKDWNSVALENRT